MEVYQTIIKGIFEDLVCQGDETREEILKRWEDGDTQDDFGNMTGSRTCSTYESQQTLQKAGFPFNDELNEMLNDCGYDLSILEKGPEAIDVILCEIIMPTMLDELRG